MTFNDYLLEKFIERGESGGMAITKDNVEDMFENWLEDMDTEEMMNWADLAMGKAFLEGREELLNKLK